MLFFEEAVPTRASPAGTATNTGDEEEAIKEATLTKTGTTENWTNRKRTSPHKWHYLTDSYLHSMCSKIFTQPYTISNDPNPDPNGHYQHGSKSRKNAHSAGRLHLFTPNWKKNYKTSLGNKLHTRLYDRLDETAYPTPCSKGADFSTRGNKRYNYGGKETVRKTGNSDCPQGTSGQRLSLPTFHCTPKRWGETTLKGLNSFVEAVHFKMEGIHMLRDTLKPGNWMTKVDLKDAYFDSNGTQPEAPATISMERDDISIQLSPLRSVVSPLGLYQDHEANSGHPQDNGPEDDHIYRRHSNHGRFKGPGKGTHSSINFSPGESRLYSELPQIPPGPNTGDRLPGFYSKLTDNGNQDARGENLTDPAGEDKETPRNGDMQSHSHITPTRQAEPRLPGNPTAMPSSFTGRRAGLQCSCPPNTTSDGRARMVAISPCQIEWAVPNGMGGAYYRGLPT